MGQHRNPQAVIPSNVEGSLFISRYSRGGGFTLVELAIALMVIGLLLGGVLKGQELIENARITRTIRTLNDYQTATRIFDLTYGGLPGDIKNPSRIPDCTSTLCDTDGDANRQIGGNLTTVATTPVPLEVSNARRYWIHLVKSGVISGDQINADYTGTPNEIGVDFPSTPFNDSAFLVIHITPAAGQPLVNTGHHFVTMSQNGLSARSALHSSAGLKGKVAAMLDIKMDDGLPLSGTVGYGGNPVCLDSAGTGYNQQSGVCNLVFLTDF